MNKSFDMLCTEYTDRLIEVINTSGMPLTVTRLILQDNLATVNDGIRQQLDAEKAQMMEANDGVD